MSTVPARISLVTLGVADLRRATDFYRALGWRPSSASVEGEVTFFHTAGGILALYGRDALAADSGREATGPHPGPAPFPGIVLALNLGSRAEVDDAVAAFVAAGGTVLRPATAADWGGYLAYVADLDGHTWELAHNPAWPLDEAGLPRLPD
ncbi:VOC family protein [Allostreptomyces psammosilenae]|uniref:VOC domain-containing protein n=1 Tax=Allostreptomyces psammosilenae TaxID=1892865 RepID=A0A853A185_9ACTN|nr:VOC family protein [Allostreptomyces psammosilenae]NYI08326.1 hypothetical protein [Allostreptomyces psammosilenae]